MRACSSATARRVCSLIAAWRLREASPSAQAPTARAMVNVVSSAVVVKKFEPATASSATSHGIDTRGGRAAATDPIPNSPATGITLSGISSR